MFSHMQIAYSMDSKQQVLPASESEHSNHYEGKEGALSFLNSLNKEIRLTLASGCSQSKHFESAA